MAKNIFWHNEGQKVRQCLRVKEKFTQQIFLSRHPCLSHTQAKQKNAFRRAVYRPTDARRSFIHIRLINMLTERNI